MRKWFARMTPQREAVLANRWLRPMADRLTQPIIWCFSRRSVARGLALGLFVGLLIPFGQVVLAALFAGAARGNLLVAAAATLVTNPLTTAPIYYAAYRTGAFALDLAGLPVAPPIGPEGFAAGNVLDMLASASLPTLLGLSLFALSSSVAGFVAVHVAWRLSLGRQWRRRSRGRTAGAAMRSADA